MIGDYSIEQLYNRIQDARTREYFDEVLSCFYSENYRSAVVMLYSVVICDLVFKLHRLVDIYNDEVAANILSEIETQQNSNPKSPDWENTLREDLLKKRRILTASSSVHLDNLQKDRHICAHPVLNYDIELHRPNKSSVYAHIINALSDILTVPAFLEKELTTQIVVDLSEQRKIIRSADQIKEYISSKYLNRINSPEIESKLFINLWKFVFKLDSEEPKKNRDINFVFLVLLYERNVRTIGEVIKANSEKLSNQVSITDLKILDYFVKFLNKYPEVYGLLQNPFKISLNAIIEKYPLLKHVCFFLHEDIKKYFEQLLDDIEPDDDVKYMIIYFTKRLGLEDALRIPISLFAASDSFAEAEDNYQSFIKPHLKKFTLRNYEQILNAIAHNGQIRHSFNVQKKFSTIKDYIKSLKSDFDFSKYDFLK